MRINKPKQTFDKGYLPNWTEEIFTATEVNDTKPPTYKLEDYRHEKIEASFYEKKFNELLKPMMSLKLKSFVYEKAQRGQRIFWEMEGPSGKLNSWIGNLTWRRIFGSSHFVAIISLVTRKVTTLDLPEFISTNQGDKTATARRTGKFVAKKLPEAYSSFSVKSSSSTSSCVFVFNLTTSRSDSNLWSALLSGCILVT